MGWQIAIDGPAGAGKSTIAKKVAEKLNFDYVDTGAMYRAVTLKALNLNINLEDENEYKFLENTKIDFKNGKIFLDDVDVSKEIRSTDVTNNVSLVSKYSYVRSFLVSLQQKLAESKNIIMDGRDIGTVVLPDANLKIFLEASVTERAKRRREEQLLKGKEKISLEDTILAIQERDYKDSNRKLSPLVKAKDAFEIDTTNLSVDEVVDKITILVMERGYEMENVNSGNEKNAETNVKEEVTTENVISDSDKTKSDGNKTAEKVLEKKLEDLEITGRTVNSLNAAGIATIGELIQKSKEEILEIKGIGPKSFEDLEKMLNENGLSLKDSKTETKAATTTKKVEEKKAETKKSKDKKATVKKAEKQDKVKKAEDKKVEPKKTEAKEVAEKVEEKQDEVKKTEDKKAEPKKAEAEKSEEKQDEVKKTEDKKVEPKKAEAKKTAEKAEEKKEEVAKEDKPLRPMQVTEGTIVDIYQAKKQYVDKAGKVVKKSKDQRILLELENGQEGILFRRDVANLAEEDDLEDLYMEGDKLKVIVKRVYPDGGRVLLSTALLEKREEIKKFEKVIENHGYFTAKVIKPIRAGLILKHEDFTCLLPHTQIRVKPENYNELVGEDLVVAPIRVDYNRIRLIVSHTVATAIQNKEMKEEFLKTVEVGQVFDGLVKNIEPYGAFVEISEGVEGLLHISEISHNRIVKVEKVVNIGDELKVQVIKVDGDHVGLSRKALLPNHWKDYIDASKLGDIVKGKIIEINRAGVVLSLNEHVQAFLPKSEFTWERDTFIEDYVQVGDEIEAKIIELDLNKKRIILSRKQLTENPWESLKFRSGDKVTAKVIKVLSEGVKVSVEGATGFLPKGNFGKVDASNFAEGHEFEARVRMFDPRRTRLILTLLENAPVDRRSVNKHLKSQEKVTSTLGDFFKDLENR